MNLESRQARIAIVERVLELLQLARSLASENGNTDRYLRAARDRIGELEIPGDPSGLAWDAAYEQRSEVLWIMDKALRGCMWDWDQCPLLWVQVQLELRLASLMYPPVRRQQGDSGDASAA